MRMEEFFRYSSKETPKVGDKCTMHFYSDSHACQVVRVSASGKTMWIRRNYVESAAKEGEGFGSQDWNIFENKFEGGEYKVTLRRNGVWRVTGINRYVALGQWHEYYDYSF